MGPADGEPNSPGSAALASSEANPPSSDPSESSEPVSPIARRSGPRAEQAFLRVTLRKCSEAGDADGESTAAASLARSLAAAGAELDLATKLARRALLLRDDPALRDELSRWFAGLGEPALAAATLRSLVEQSAGTQAASTSTRMAVLMARTGDAGAAADALTAASTQNPADAVAPELLGSLAAWAPDVVSPDRAAQGYLEGAARREAAGERAAAFEDLLRAFEMAPGSAVASERLCAALASRGRIGAADEVRRQTARARGDREVEVHLRRMQEMAANDDLTRAIGAAFDARCDGGLDWASARRALGFASERTRSEIGFDELLHRGGLYELLAARLELMCEALEMPDRAQCLLALGRLCAGPLASPERAVDAWVDALALDPASEEAKTALRGLAASTHDPAPLLEGLIRASFGVPRDLPARLACLRELMVLAEQRLADPGLTLWAVQRLEAAGVTDPELPETRARLAQAARLQEEERASLREALVNAGGRERASLLRRLAAILFGRPDATDEYLTVLGELTRRFPDERQWRVSLERICWRTQRIDDLVELLRETVERSAGKPDATRAALALAAIQRRRGDLAASLREIEPELRRGATHGSVWSMAMLLSARLGDDRGRARALVNLSVRLPPPLRAVLGSVAAELLLAAGEVAEARTAAKQAHHADPTLARPTASVAAVALQSRDPGDMGALERAMGVVVPRAAFCQVLAQSHEDAGEIVLAVAWTQRWLALRPGDPDAAVAMLRRVTAAGDGDRLADALAWLLSQPQPLARFAGALGTALTRLAALLPERGAALARRTLDVVGPRIEPLRGALLEVAELAGDRALALATVERWLAAGAPGAERTEILLDVARRRRAAGDPDGAARALARAMSEGCDPAAVLAEVEQVLQPRSSDGNLALLEARAEALSSGSVSDLKAVALAWREFGAALWDLAGDTDRAIRAWERAAALDPETGIRRLAADLVEFAGAEAALDRLLHLASRRQDSEKSARFFVAAGWVAADAGLRERALSIALEAIEKSCWDGELLSIAERVAGKDLVDELARVYDRVAGASLGCYGERAIRYRAARQLDDRGARDHAFRNAVAAFEAVPAVGVAFVLASRLAERTDRQMDLIRAVERVAAKAKDDAHRAEWLERAAKLAGSDAEGQRERVEVLLRVLAVRSDVDALRSLGEAVGDLIRSHPEDTEVIELRFERAMSSMLSRLDGPDGARAAIEAAHAALSAIDSAPLATSALDRALRCCADLEEYERLWELAPRLANAPEEAQAVLSLMQTLSSAKFAAVSRELVELGVRLAREFDDKRSAASLLVHAALRDRDDEELARRASRAAEDSGDPDLLALLVDLVPTARRTESLLAVAEAAEQADDPDAATAALREVVVSDDTEETVRRETLVRLRQLLEHEDRRSELAELLMTELERKALEPGERAELAEKLVELVNDGVDVAAIRVIQVLQDLARERPDDPGPVRDVAAVSRRFQDGEALTAALTELVRRAPDAETQQRCLRELAAWFEARGEHVAAAERYRELLERHPDDHEALVGLERDAERRSDYEALASVLQRRARVASGADEVRQLGLRRAEVLDARLGRSDESRSELEALLTAVGEDVVVLTRLADLNQRLGNELRAAPLWLRASAAASGKDESEQLAQRACEASLRGGDVASARRVLDERAGDSGSERWLALRVEVERRSENPRGLAQALERLADVSRQPPEARAALLVEAVQASEAAGDAEGALERAQLAARIAPKEAMPQLWARLLEYRARGAGTAADARITVAELRGIATELEPELAELKAFLIAEALEVAVNAEVSIRELERAHDQLGPVPLVSVAMAERLARGDDPARCLPFYDAALSGDFRGLRARGPVALHAAEIAYAQDDFERALQYLEIAASEPDSRSDALALAAMVRADVRGEPIPEPVLSTPDTVPPGTLPYPGLVDLVEDEEAAEELDPDDLEEVAEEVEPAAPRPATPASAAPPSPRGEDAEPSPPSSAPPPYFGVDQEHPSFPPVGRDEASLLDALARGSVEAGQELASRLSGRADRSHDRLSVCRRLAVLMPGNSSVLDRLHAAALADHNPVYAQAVLHARQAFTETPGPPPPPLIDQPEQPELVRAVLFRCAHGNAAQALALVWNGAAHVFRRDPSDYNITGMERVPFGAPRPLGRMYAAAARALGLTRTPLFQRRNMSQLALSVALLSPPALIVNGDPSEESAEFCYHLGAMLAATLPEHLLMLGTSPAEARGILDTLVFTFGPPSARANYFPAVANLAEVLWESIPPSSQRTLRRLCDDPALLEYGLASVQVRRAVRRAGLFVAGDLGVAVRATCAELGISTQLLSGPEGLAAACSASPDISDLVRLATSPRYALARWQSGRGSSPSLSGT